MSDVTNRNGRPAPNVPPLPPVIRGSGIATASGSSQPRLGLTWPDGPDADAALPADDAASVVVKFYLPRAESAAAPPDATAPPRIVTQVVVPPLAFAQVAAEFADQLEAVLAKGAVPQAAVDEWREACRKRRAQGREIAHFMMSALCFAQVAVQLDEELNGLVAQGAVPQSAVDELRAAARRRRAPRPT